MPCSDGDSGQSEEAASWEEPDDWGPELDWAVDNDGNAIASGVTHSFTIEFNNTLWVYGDHGAVVAWINCESMEGAQDIADAMNIVHYHGGKVICHS
jgi:hypothetical protein